MACVDYRRILDGMKMSGKFGESLQITERWHVRVDTPDTSKLEILSYITQAGVYWGAPHFEVPALKAMEFDLAPTGKDGMLWHLSVNFYVPPQTKAPTANGIPEDFWQRAGGTTSVPAFEDINGDMITNSANDPLEGLEREREEASWTLTKHYEDDASLDADIFAYAGTVNGSTWAGGGPKTWKCYFKSASRKSVAKFTGDDDGGLLEYIEAQWEFRYDPGTWKCMPWDVGFMELNGSGEKVAILTDDGKVVKQPVALNSDGSAKPAGEKPSVINTGDGVDIYATSDFDAGFGAPHLMPEGSGGSEGSGS